MSKIGNEARLIQKVVNERIERRAEKMKAQILPETTTDSFKAFNRGYIEGMHYAMQELQIVSNELENGR